MRKLLIILAVMLQVLVLVYMAAEREWIVQTGKTIFLRTAPVDPRDLFRGDYVRLNYEISSVPVSQTKGTVKKEAGARGRKVYAVLKEGRRGLADLDYVTDERPKTGLFIRGRQESRWIPTGVGNAAVQVRYGIESYYVQQGAGREIEQGRSGGSGIQVPLEIEVALGSSGTAVIKNHRWSPLGIGLTTIENAVQHGQEGRKSSKVRVTLMNASPLPLAIVHLPELCSFSLEAVMPERREIRLATPPCAGIKPSHEDILLLQPKEKREFDFDFSDPRWHIMEKGKPVEIGTLRFQMFRLVYKSPSPESCAGLQNAELIYYGTLASRPFRSQGDRG